MARRNKTGKRRGILWWIFVGWWWYPYKWLFFTLPKTLIKKAAAPQAQKPPMKQEAARSKPPEQGEPSVKKIGYPRQVSGHPIRYAYVLAFEALDGVDVINDVLAGEEKIVDVKAEGAGINLLLNGKIFGVIRDERKAEMLFDWEKKGFPCHAVLLASGKQVNLRFYQDKRVGNDWREQTVVALTGFKAERKQDEIGVLTPGDEVQLDEDYEKECRVVVYGLMGDTIGALPKKTAERVIEEGAYAAYFERGEEDDEGIVKPFIRIYWR